MKLLPRTLDYALRMLFKNPGVALVAILALGLGIGANTAIYSLADILVFRPLLLPDLDRVVTVIGTQKRNKKYFDQIAPADFLDFKSQNQTVDNLGALADKTMNLTGDGEAERVSGARATASFFRALGGQPFLGRTFLDGEESPGADRVVVLSYSLWSGRFAADPAILKRSIQLEGQSYRVIGVMPKDFRYPAQTDLWIPLALSATQRSSREVNSLIVVGRLKNGVSVSNANSDFEALSARIAEQFPESHRSRTTRVELLREYVSGNLVIEFTRMLLGCVAFVLLIACANVANLQFARVSLRSKEMAIRSAMGASRFRLVSQFLFESGLLGIFGASVGLLLAFWGTDLMRTAIPPEIQRELPGWTRLGINAHVLWFTLAAAVAAGLLAGIVPAWIGSRTDLAETLKETGRGTSSGVRRHRIRSVLVVGQIVLALALMVGAGLIARGSRLVSDPAPGIDSARALTMRISLPESKYPKPGDVAAFQERLLRSLQSIDGVATAAIVSNLPYSGSFTGVNLTIEGRDARAAGTPAGALNQCISPGYFRALHLPMREGREFTESDGQDAPPVAIVSRALATQYYPGQNPIGRHLKIGLPSSDSPWITIVGVVSDMRINPFDKSYRPALYRPCQQRAFRSFDVLIRTPADPRSLMAAARAQVAAIDRDQPVYQLKTLEAVFNDQLSGFRFLAVLMGIFGFVALFLSSIGVYAVMAHSVNERTHEIGVRMALGARQKDVLWMIVRRGLVLTGIGILIGLPVTLALARLLANVVFGVSEYDPATFGTGLIVLAAAAMLACYIPARRATRVDPMVTLRTE
jgi:putative ABC transport system permease protein